MKRQNEEAKAGAFAYGANIRCRRRVRYVGCDRFSQCLTSLMGFVPQTSALMNRTEPHSRSLIASIVFVAMAVLYGCASYDAQNKESLLTAAGFRARTPSTAAQQAMFNRMVPYKVERRVRNGKVLYAYADPQNNVVYIGGENEYQAYKQLGLQQSIAQDQLEAAQINEDASMYNWGPYWGPWNPWW
jgi:hypothetical protein